jgi:hypothetical protein
MSVSPVKKFVNLTPHVITYISPSGEKLVLEQWFPSARIDVEKLLVKSYMTEEGFLIPLYTTINNGVTGLPEPEQDTFFVVSKMVADALSHRTDLVCVASCEVRGEGGVIIGCNGFCV